MKPNMFIYSGARAEDFFSSSLAYITNLFPAIGQSLMRRIAVLAGKPPSHFGKFEECEFVGHEYLEGHRSSRPDLMIKCSKGTIYFENKLESPLKLSQLQRHARFAGEDPRRSLIFVSNLRHTISGAQSLRGYIYPAGYDHYLWMDLEPALSQKHRKGSHAASILADFNAALRANGMIGRSIKGAKGSLYTDGSDASHLALEQLWQVLYEVGFKLARKSPRERTIRAYPSKYREYPLLNPRFKATAAHWDPSWDRDCLEITVISRGDTSHLDRYLKTFGSSRTCAFAPQPFYSADEHHYHGHFLMPVRFSGRGHNTEIDFDPMKKTLRNLLGFLQDYG